MNWLRFAAVAGAALLFSKSTHATDLWGVRLETSGAVATSPAAATMAALGGTYEFFVNGWGLRFGGDLGLAHYSLGGRTESFTLSPELAFYRGRDAATWRTYWVGQAIFAARSEVFEGFRIGPELEWRDICESNLRIASGLFYHPVRDRDGMAWGSAGLRMTVTWGLPTQGCVQPVEREDLPPILN